jgi:transcriptional regulator with XRE-family HTH domain
MSEDRDGAESPGVWLRRRRESAGLTQEELAERSGLATRTISNLESDRIRRPHPRSLQAVVTALGLSVRASAELQARFWRQDDGGAGRSCLADEREPAGAAAAVPQQLPSTVPLFVGRSAEFARLERWLDKVRNDAERPAIFGIAGMAGVGKTALALHWAHRVASEFPDGQLHVSLGGYRQVGQPTGVAEALGGLLVALGVAPSEVPATLEDRSARCRRLVAGRRMLIVIDDAEDAAQVRALGPGIPGCVVVVTSRRQLTDQAVNDGARLLTLDVLTAAEAAALLSARLGPGRVLAEPEAVRELIAVCGRLPLALVIVAARIAVSGCLLSVLATQLADARHRLDALDLGESIANLRSVLSGSCQQLSIDGADLLRLLALHPEPEFGVRAAAGLAGIPAPLAQATLSELARASVITERRPGRYRMHDLLKLYVAEQYQSAGA